MSSVQQHSDDGTDSDRPDYSVNPLDKNEVADLPEEVQEALFAAFERMQGGANKTDREFRIIAIDPLPTVDCYVIDIKAEDLYVIGKDVRKAVESKTNIKFNGLKVYSSGHVGLRFKYPNE